MKYGKKSLGFGTSLLSLGLLVVVGIIGIYLLKHNTLPKRAGAAPNVGFGVMGDSNSDEYRADDNRGGKYSETTFNWVEILARKREFDFGAWGSWGEPRRKGYEYNWSRSGAKSSDLNKQQTGLIKQVSEGKVKYVFIQIGVNDFHLNNGTYKEIYSSDLNGSRLQAKLDDVYSDIKSATDSMINAGAYVILATVPDAGKSPAAFSKYPDTSKRQLVTDAIEKINTRLKNNYSANNKVFVYDLNNLTSSILSRVVNSQYIVIGGEKINVITTDNDPHSLQLGDSSNHPGTIASGIYANEVAISVLNSHFGLNIAPLTDEELLDISGIKPLPTPKVEKTNPPETSNPTPIATNGPVKTDTPRPEVTGTPKPSQAPTTNPIRTFAPRPTEKTRPEKTISAFPSLPPAKSIPFCVKYPKVCRWFASHFR